MVNTRKSSPTGERPYVVLGVTGGIAAYKTPRMVHLLPELPRTGSGKIAKRVLRERLG